MSESSTVTASTVTAARVPLLSTAEDAVAAARSYAASIADGAIERDRAGKVPYAELAALDASGLLGITVPRAFGGPDLPPTVLAEVIRTIAAVDPAIAQIPQAHFLFVDVLAVHGRRPQQQRLFADVLAGARFGNAAAERGGQHAQDLKTRLLPDPSGPELRAGRAEVLQHRARSRPAGSGPPPSTEPTGWCWRSSSGMRPG